MILADTSIWIDHFRRGNVVLGRLLDDAQVLMHPFILGELACGNLRDRASVLGLLSNLPRSSVAEEEEALVFIDAMALMGRGIGYVDVHLLAAVSLDPDSKLWTRDKRLQQVATELDLAHV